MLVKTELKHGRWYVGRCRNSRVAMWDGRRQVFIYLREKFGSIFVEEICHPEDSDGDDGFDLFMPEALLADVLDRKEER